MIYTLKATACKRRSVYYPRIDVYARDKVIRHTTQPMKFTTRREAVKQAECEIELANLFGGIL